ncbi:MAG: HPP family protein [Kofleriaceae bacterium]
MSNDLVCAYDDLEIGALVSLMLRHHIGSIPILDRSGRAIGVVTKTDLVEHLDGMLRTPAAGEQRPHVVRARDLMMPLPLTLPESATIAQAAKLMLAEDIHHVLVSSEGGFLVGVVSSIDLVRWMVAITSPCDSTHRS